MVAATLSALGPIVADVRVVPYRVPLPAPVSTARGVVCERAGCLLGLVSSGGRVGWGEAALWPGFGSDSVAAGVTDGEGAQSVGSLEDGLRALIDRLVGVVISAAQPAPEVCGEAWASLPVEAQFAVDGALWSLRAQEHQGAAPANLAACLAPEDWRQKVGVHALVVDEAAARDAVAGGYGALKLKGGAEDWQADVARVARVRAAVGSSVHLRLDMNGAWDLAQLQAALPLLEKASVALDVLEQPLPVSCFGDDALAELALLRCGTSVALAVDEWVSGPHAAQRLHAIAEHQAADEVVLKPMFLGAIATTQALAQIAASAGLRVGVTHVFESSVGRDVALHTAAAVVGPMAPCGLGGTGFEIEETASPLAGVMAVPYVRQPSMLVGGSP